MTDDELEAMFRTSLNGHADEAVDSGDRVAAAHASVRRRRRVLTGMGVVAAAVILAPAAVFAVTLRHGAPDAAAPSPSAGSLTSPFHDLPPDWRWESFHGVEVGVPADWRDGSSTGGLTGNWCIGKPRAEARVGRPGLQFAVGCPGFDGGPDPGLQIENAGRFVAFDPSTHLPDGSTTEGDRTTVTLGGVSVLVQAESSLRSEIIGTIGLADPDPNGCPVTDPISKDPAARPDPAVDITRLTDVTAVTACRYELPVVERDPSELISSLRLSGDNAVQAVSAVAALPIGSGPDDPRDCSGQASYGEEIVVLHIISRAGESSVYMRFSGCADNGFDDGVSVRALTIGTAPLFLAGPNIPTSETGSLAKLRILFGPDGP